MSGDAETSHETLRRGRRRLGSVKGQGSKRRTEEGKEERLPIGEGEGVREGGNVNGGRKMDEGRETLVVCVRKG